MNWNLLYLNMELKIDIGFDQLLYAIKQLPDRQRAILKQELGKKKKVKIQNADFKDFLLDGPVFNEDQLKTINDTREQINKWQTK